MVNLEEIKTWISQEGKMEEVLQKFNWKEFEKFIAEIFQNNGFVIKRNFRFKTKNRYEIDLIATSNRFVFCVDCKMWNQGRYKKTGLKNAINLQEKRVKELEKFLNKNPIAKSLLKINQNYSMAPLIVTLHEEDTIKENDTFVVPAWKLNNFVNELENYI